MISHISIVISFKEEESTKMSSSKMKGTFLVQYLDTFEDDIEIPSEDATLYELKKIVNSYNKLGYQVVSLSNSGGRRQSSGLSLNSTIVMSRKV